MLETTDRATDISSSISLTIHSSLVSMMSTEKMYNSVEWESEVVKTKDILVKYRLDILALAGAVLGTFALKFLWNYFFPTFQMLGSSTRKAIHRKATGPALR